MIDTPVKNIYERNNRELFESFYGMLYEVDSNELKETQFILVDKKCRVELNAR